MRLLPWVLGRLEEWGGPRGTPLVSHAELQPHRVECPAHGHVSGYQREVLLCSSCPRTKTNSKCLQSLPNLHTLEVALAEGVENTATTPLKKALGSVKLPQVKTLIIPPAALLFSNTVVVWRILSV